MTAQSGRCQAPDCDAAVPACRGEMSGWLTGTLRRWTRRGQLTEPAEIAACSRHRVVTALRQIQLGGQPLQKVVTTAPRSGCRHCGFRLDGVGRPTGWAEVKLNRLRGADELPLKITLCPKHSVAVA